MANTAEIFNFPVPDVAQKGRVWQISMMVIRALQMSCWKCDAGRINTAPASGLPGCHAQTYGFNKKLDWVSNEQLSELTGYCRTSVLLQKVFW